MAGVRTDNTFEGGLSFDSDKQKLSKQQYLDSINGRLLYNKQGSISWENIEGNRLNVTITPRNGTDNANYIPIGFAMYSKYGIIFLVNPLTGDSEVGLFNVKEKGIGQYKTLFNDLDDPNGNRLLFQPTNQIDVKPLEENENIIRAYWVDGVKDDSNPPRSFTWRYDSSLDAYDINSYIPITDSVHSINAQAEINFGIIKFKKTILGNILSGSYKFVYRLRTDDGYASPWSPLTQRLDVTTDVVSSANWNDYEMEGSGLDTKKGFELEIKGIDQRFDTLQVAYVFYETDSVVSDSKIFKTIFVNTDTEIINFIANAGTPLNTDDITALFVVIAGAKTLNFKDATNYYGNVKEGNLSFTKEEIDVVLENLVMEPKIKDMESDNRGYYGKTTNPDPYNNEGVANTIEWTAPVTNQPTTPTAQIVRPVHSGLNESYDVRDDYINYKGTQVSHLYKGYFRSEKYRFGIVFYDKKGVPGFVYHLADFTFPEQYSDEYSWTRLKADTTTVNFSGNAPEELWVTNDYNHLVGEKATSAQSSLGNLHSELRILGLKIGGIDISTIKDKISMVKIVRVKRDGNILYQGLNVPLVYEDDNPLGKVVRPMNSIEHSWKHWDSGGAGIEPLENFPLETDRSKMVQESCRDFHNPLQYVNIYRPDDAEIDQDCASCVWAPDLEFDQQRVPAIITDDKLRVVSSCFTYPRFAATGLQANWQYAYGLDHAGAGEPGDTIDKVYSFDGMLKLFFSNNGYHLSANNPAEIYVKYGAEATLLGSVSFTSRDELGGSVDGFISNFLLYNEIESFEDRAAAWNSLNPGGARYSKSYVKQGSFYYKHGFYSGSTNAFAPLLRHDKTELDYPFSAGPNTVFTDSQQNSYGFHIVNYIRENFAAYGGLDFSALEQNLFIDTGYSCTVGNSTFTDPINDIIDDAEIWGGDCYLDYIGIQAYYPRMWLDENGYPDLAPGNNPQNNDKVTTSTGIVFPLESDLNYSMRNSTSADNAMYSDIGAAPAITYYEGDSASQKARNWRTGLFQKSADEKFIEEFNLNEVLSLESILKFYFTQPLFFDESLFRFPIRWRFTQVKIYGDPIDTWRIFLANNFNDLQGRYGHITSSTYLFDQIYSFQERSFGKLRAYNRTGLVTPDQGNLTTGIGDALDGVDYLSTDFGNQHQWSLINSGKAMYWVDIDKQKILRFAQDGLAPISDFRSMHDYPKTESHKFIGKDNPAYTEGIQTVYDHGNNEVIFSFLTEKFITLNGSVFVTDEDFQLNDTLFYDVNQLGVVIDITTEYTIFYICISDNNAANLNINGTDLKGLAADTCYRVTSRNGVYTLEVVGKSEITPYRYNLVYSEDMNVFSQFYSNKARYWFTYNAFMLSSGWDALDSEGNKNKIWLHGYGSDYGSYYGEVHKSLLKINVNENGMLHKIFDSLRVNVNREDLFSYFVYDTDSQNYWIDLPTFGQAAYKENIYRYPVRWLQQPDRTRGKFLTMSWDVDNTQNEEIRISSVGTNYRLSNRI